MIAIDMPMPKKCDDCPCRQINLARCQITGKSTSHSGTRPIDQRQRPSWCPLIDLTQYEDNGK